MTEDGGVSTGSLIVFEADTFAQAEAFADNDPYVKAGTVRQPRHQGVETGSSTARSDDVMAYWLMKSEPSSWSWDDQVKAGTAEWDGVRNHQAATP